MNMIVPAGEYKEMQQCIIDVGEKILRIPYREINNGDGPVVVITAGMDGDEYAGIVAVYELAQELASFSFCGTIRIVPIVNIEGFQTGISQNPLDGLYPKHVFPGKIQGRPTERLLFHFWKQFGADAFVWIDLHGGSLHEKLTCPFVWGFESENREIDRRMKQYLAALHGVPTVVSTWDKVRRIGEMGCVYLCLESGDQGKVERRFVDLHKVWVKRILQEISSQAHASIPVSYYHDLDRIVAPERGAFTPRRVVVHIHKGEMVGELRTSSGMIPIIFAKKQEGVVLYHRTEGMVQKGAELLVLARNLIEG